MESGSMKPAVPLHDEVEVRARHPPGHADGADVLALLDLHAGVGCQRDLAHMWAVCGGEAAAVVDEHHVPHGPLSPAEITVPAADAKIGVPVAPA